MVQRVFDALVAGLLLVLTSPIALVSAAAIRFSSRGPALYRATRVGRGGETFVMYKFRTMRADSAGSAVTMRGDHRVTGVGRVLRKLKLDELPQLVNVLKGDMSLVGPRPEDPKYVAGYTDEQRRILSVRPGITSPAVVRYRHEEAVLAAAEDLEAAYVDTVLPAKLAIDLDYIDRRTFRSDLGVLTATLRALFTRS